MKPVTRTMSEKQALMDLVDDDQRLARRLLLLGARAVLEPVIADGQSNNERHSERRLEVFGEFHRRINPDWKSNQLGTLGRPGNLPKSLQWSPKRIRPARVLRDVL